MINRIFSLDFAGAITATVCALHCATLPLLLSLGFVSGGAHNHTFDFTMMFIGVVIAGYSLVRDYIKKHKNPLPTSLAIFGFIMLFIGIETHGELIYLNVLGGLLIVGSHLLNYRITHTKHTSQV